MVEPSAEQIATWASEDQGPLTKNLVIAFTVVAFVCVSLRIFTRLRYNIVGWEDHTIILAMCLSIATCVFQVLQVKAGNGKHAYFVSAGQTQLFLEYLFWSIICYNTALMFIKVSIILQYRRIFTLHELRIPLDISLGICIAWGICTTFTSVFTCVPIDAYWVIAKKATAKCLKDEDLWFANAGINIFTDLLIAILPVKVIWRLHIPRRQKIALLGILTIGWFVCVVSLLRLKGLILVFQHSDDRTYYGTAVAYWSAIEMNLGIVCASLPALKPLVVKIVPAFSTRHTSRGYDQSYGRGPLGRSDCLGSKITQDNDMELANTTVDCHAFSSSKSEQGLQGGNIYVTQQFEQRVEDSGLSDSESQKDLVANSEYSTKK